MKKITARQMEKKIEAMRKAMWAAFDLLGDEDTDGSEEEDLRNLLHLTNSGTQEMLGTLQRITAQN